MIPVTLRLADEQCADVQLAGGKAARLSELRRRDLPVPDGFVVTTAAYAAFIEAHALGPASSVEDVTARWLPDAFTQDIDAALEALGPGPYAVRSSGVGEDSAQASWAGQFETVLDVEGADAVRAAIVRCFASAFADRVKSYGHEARVPTMAVLVQRMVQADAAGVAFTADPVTGDRGVTLVSAVRGLGESLVSGERSAEEWEVRGETVVRKRSSDDVLEAGEVRDVAALAARVAASYGAPQDIEWATSSGRTFLLQARPLTALPDLVEWKAPHPGCWIRNFRLGEWIGDPVTPSFETWLLDGLERRATDNFEELTAFRAPLPLHVTVNGWYFYGFNMPKVGLGTVLSVLRFFFLLATRFRELAAVIPPIAHLGFDDAVARWRRDLLPRYRTLVDESAERVETASVDELPSMIDALTIAAGDQLTSIVGVAGYAAKTELPLAKFWKAHLSAVDGSWLDIVTSEDAHLPAAHHVQGLDWFLPTLGEAGGLDGAVADPQRRERAKARGASVERAARAALEGQPKLLARFTALLSEARRAHPIRQEQTGVFTLAWPVLRRCMLRIGEHLAELRVVDEPTDVFFLERAEIEAALAGASTRLGATARERAVRWEHRRRLSPPLILGALVGPLKEAYAQIEAILETSHLKDARTIVGMPGSPGRVTGPVRVLRSMGELGRLKPGEILVAPVTTPGWTPAFARALAIVTDTGSIASHASIVAREYGIPAVVAAENATTRLCDGQRVTVDGSRGVIELAE